MPYPVELLSQELTRMQLFSEQLFSYYFQSLYVLGIAAGAVLFIVITQYENITKMLFTQPSSSAVPSILILILLLIGAWAALWLYMNKELWMARWYMGMLENQIHSVDPNLKGYEYYSNFIRGDHKLYSDKYNWNEYLNGLVASFVIFAVCLLVGVYHKVTARIIKSGAPRTGWSYRTIFYLVLSSIITIIIMVSYEVRSIPREPITKKSEVQAKQENFSNTDN